MGEQLNWTEHHRKSVGLIKELFKTNSEMMQPYSQMHKACLAPNALDTKTKELIALGIGVHTRCDGCIAAHTRAALHAGATREEVTETLGVAIMMGGGPAVVYAARALDALNEMKPE